MTLQCSWGDLSTTRPAMEADVCSTNMRIVTAAGTPSSVYWELYQNTSNSVFLGQLLEESTSPGYGTTKCDECVVTHPSQCRDPGYTQEDYDDGRPCPCNRCSRKVMDGEFLQSTDTFMSEGEMYEASNYHCNTASGLCECGSPPGQLLMEHVETHATGQKVSLCVCLYKIVKGC